MRQTFVNFVVRLLKFYQIKKFLMLEKKNFVIVIVLEITINHFIQIIVYIVARIFAPELEIMHIKRYVKTIQIKLKHTIYVGVMNEGKSILL